MAAGRRYSAGRIFLQVVPSFKNLQNDIQREVNKANRPLEKQHEELGKRAEAARERGASTQRKKSAAQELRDAERLQDAKLKQHQRFTQMYLGEVVKEAKRREDVERRNAKNLLNLMTRNAQGQAELDKRNAKYRSDLARAIWAGDAKERERAARETARLRRQNLDLEIADLARAAREKAKAEADAQREADRKAARDEAARDRVRKRRAQQRLTDLRRAAREEDRLRGGGSGRMIRDAARSTADDLYVKINADSSPAERKVAALREKLLLIDAHIGVDMDTGEALTQIKLIKKELDLLARKKPDVKVEANVMLALANLKRVEQQLDQLNRKKAKSGFLSMFAGASAGAGDGANSFRIFNYRVLALLMLLPTLAPLLASTAGAIGALATAAVGGAAGLGVMIAGFTGLGDAISAMGEVHDNAAKDALANEKAQRVAAKGVRDAEQGVARAREMASRSAEDNARRVADARRRVGDVEKQTARSIRDALRAQRDAEKNLADAQRDATKAQQELREARKQAERDQQDLADKIAAGKLDERQALIDLFNAQVAYNEAMADGGATNLEKEQVSINLERARLAIKGIRQENADLLDEQKNGNPKAAQAVESAQERVVGAQDRVKDAQERVADAAERLRDAQVDGARDIADAHQAVTDALRDQGYAAADSARSIRDAEERLTDAQAAYQEALTKTGEIGSASMQKLELAMGKLGPAGRSFATFIFELMNGFQSLRNEIQEGMLPPLQKEMQLLIDTYGPEFKDFVRGMAVTVGQFFTAFGEALRSPVMRTFFETMAKYAPIFFTQFGDIFISLMKIIGGLMTAFAPFAKDFMDAFAGMMRSVADWAEGLAGSNGFNEFIDYVKREGPKVLALIGSLVTLILNIGKGMAETPIFDTIVSFFGFLASLDPNVVAVIFTLITGLAFASQVAAGVNALAISVRFLVTSAIGPWVLGLAAVAVALVALYQNNEDFRKGVDAVWQWIQGVFGSFLDWIQNTFLPWWTNEAMPVILHVFDEIARVAKWLWDNILFPLFQFGAEFLGKVFTIIGLYWKNILWPVFKAIASVAGWLWENILSPIFAWIGEAFRNMVGVIKWVWDNILSKIFDAIIHVLEGDFTGAFASAVDAVKGIWNGLKRIAAEPVNFIIQTVLNEGLFSGINKIFDFFGLSMRIPDIPRVSWGQEYEGASLSGKKSGKNAKFFDVGGWTGPGAKYDVAGVVHADEFVLKKEATNRLRRQIGLEGLEFMNRYGMLPTGYAIGGMVKPVNAAPRFPWGHYPSGRVHRALDLAVPTGTPVVSPFSGTIIRDGWDGTGFGTHVRLAADNGTYWILGHLLREIVSVGQRVLGGTLLGATGNSGNSTGPHLHLEGRMSPYDPSSAFNFTSAFNGGVTRTPPAGEAAANLPWWADKPLEFLRDLVNAGVGKITTKGFFGDLLRGVPNKLFDGARNFLSRLLGSGAGDLDDTHGTGGKFLWNGREVPDNGTQMFDVGGLLQPGVTQVLNMTGKPEPVFTADQWASRGGAGGPSALVDHLDVDVNGTDLTAGDVADEIIHALRRVSHGGKYAGVAR